MRSAGSIALAFCLCACSFPAPPALLPPPFGPDPQKPEPAHFFFPTGIAVDSTGQWLLVANSNSDHAYDAGAVYALRVSSLLPHFGTQPPSGDVDFPIGALAGTAMIGNYAGPLLVAGTTAYTGSRDTNRLNAVVLDPATGSLSCRTAAGTDAGNQDCRGGIVDLGAAASVEGPFGLAQGKVRPIGAPADIDALLVSALIPHIDTIVSGVAFSSSHLAALDTRDPSQVLFSATVTDRLNGAGIGASNIVYDERRREVILSGCYQRFANVSQGGDPSSGKCGSGGLNLLRFVPVDAGAAAVSRLYDLGVDLHTVETDGLALADFDPATAARTLYVTTRNPDLLARIGVPDEPGLAPEVMRAIPLPSQPSQILRLARPAGATGGDLLVVTTLSIYQTSTVFGRLILVDGTLGRVVGQIDGLGDTPYAMAQLPPQAGDTSARLAVSVFGSCRVSLVEVPYDNPTQVSLRANLGKCP